VCKNQAAAIPQVLRGEIQRRGRLPADYDTEKELKKQLKVTGQSTLVVFKGEKEVGREQGVTAAAAVASSWRRDLKHVTGAGVPGWFADLALTVRAAGAAAGCGSA
jgi:hypothetical protein